MGSENFHWQKSWGCNAYSFMCFCVQINVSTDKKYVMRYRISRNKLYVVDFYYLVKIK